MRSPTKEELADLLREYPTWGHAAVALKEEAIRQAKIANGAMARVAELEEALAHLLDALDSERPRYASESVRQAVEIARGALEKK